MTKTIQQQLTCSETSRMREQEFCKKGFITRVFLALAFILTGTMQVCAGETVLFEGSHDLGWSDDNKSLSVSASTISEVTSTTGLALRVTLETTSGDWWQVQVCDIGNKDNSWAWTPINVISTKTDNSRGYFTANDVSYGNIAGTYTYDFALTDDQITQLKNGIVFQGSISNYNNLETAPQIFIKRVSVVGPCNVTYDANGGSGTLLDDTDYAYGATVTVKGNTFSKSEATFLHWNTKADGSGTSYWAENTFGITDDVTLYAVWKNHTVYTDGTIGSITVNDNTFWTAFSPCTTIKKGETCQFTFKNYGGTENWYNYMLVATNKEGHGTMDVDGYSEYFVLRADNYGWGTNYQTPSTCSYSSDWDTWKTNMASGNFTTTMNVKFTGTQFVMTSTTTNGTTNYTYDFTSKEFTDAESACLFFTVDHSYLTDFTAIKGTCAAPVFSPASGTYSGPQSVTISTTTDGASIYYTRDGSDPATLGTLYESPITVSATNTILAVAKKDGYANSEKSVATYEINSIDPTITFDGGSYTIGGTALDLSKLFTSNSDGTVTYIVKDANGTGAAITGTSFTATAVGTTTVTATQAAGSGYNAISADATITVLPTASVPTTYTLDGNDQTLTVSSLAEPVSKQGILLPAGYTESVTVTAGTWTNVKSSAAASSVTGWAVSGMENYYEVYTYGTTADGGLAAGDVLTQTVTGLDDNYAYEVVLNVAASYTAGRGFTCPTGSDLTVAFAGDKTVNIPVVERSNIASGEQNTVVFVVKPTDGSLTFGLRNVAASGNWYVASLQSIKKITNSSTFAGWYTAAEGGNRVGGAGDSYVVKDNVTTLYAHWGTLVSGVTLDKSAVYVANGETVTLTPTITPSDAVEKTLEWSTGDASVATVEGGVVKGIVTSGGHTTITATSVTDATKSATCDVYVYRFSPKGSNQKTSYNFGDGTNVLNIYAIFKDATDPSLTAADFYVESSNTNVVTSSIYGYSSNEQVVKINVTPGNTVGVATLKVYYNGSNENYKGKYATIVITVNDSKLSATISDLTVNSSADSYTMPTPVVKFNGTEVASSNYTVAYTKSAGDDIVNISGSTLTLAGSTGNWTTGSEELTATITFTADFVAANSCASSAVATFNVNVVSTAWKVESKEITHTRGTVFTNDAGNLSVTLGGWIFPNSISGLLDTYGTTSEPLGDDTAKGKTYDWSIGKTKLDVDGYTYEITGNGNKNARNEYGNNAQPQSTAIYSASLEKLSTTCIDPMFNVPCTGSYLVFEPKVNGTVTAIIEQNGVFDTSNSNLGYRPQRHVFVVDEKGTLIQSTPTLLNTGGTFDSENNDFTKYTWDLGDNVNASAELLKSHFGIENFSSGDDFKNGIYECLIDNKILHNAAVEQGAKFAGARGWAVLIAAPVKYTFDVKAGKTYYLYNFVSKIGFYGFDFKESASTVDAVTYTDTQDNTVTATASGHVASVSLNRKFNVGKWNAAVLPFSLNKQQVDAIFGATYDKNNTSGTEILYFEKVDGNVVYYTRHAYNTIVAGKPFLIKPTGKLSASSTDVDVATASEDGSTITVNTSMVSKYPYVTIENTQPAKWGRDAESANYWWASDYKVQTIVPGDYYINATGNLIMREKSNAKIQAFRSYLKKSSTTSAAKLSVAMTSMFDEEDTPTLIEGIEMDEEGNVYNVPTSGKIYNINGQVVGSDPSKLNSLPAGFYIVNGEKYIVK